MALIDVGRLKELHLWIVAHEREACRLRDVAHDLFKVRAEKVHGLLDARRKLEVLIQDAELLNAHAVDMDTRNALDTTIAKREAERA